MTNPTLTAAPEAARAEQPKIVRSRDKPRRAATWQDVAMLALVVVLALGAGALTLICAGRWPS